MPLTQKIADEIFDGDVKKAIPYILKTYEYDELDLYVDEWGPDEAAHAAEFISSEAKKNLPKNGRKAIEILYELDLEEDDVLSKPNPFRKILWKKIGILVVTCVAVPILLGAFTEWFSTKETIQKWVLMGLSCYITLQATTIASLISKTLKFNKAKKILQKQNPKIN